MNFSVDALIPNATSELASAMLKRSGLSHVTKSGILVTRLLAHRELSYATYPDEWRDKGPDNSPLFRYSPNYSQGVVHTIYKLPEELAEAPYRLTLEEAEVHERGSYCQVVTGYNGERIRPYRREGERSRWLDRYVHPTVSIFSAPELGVLRLDANAARQQGCLTIHRAKVEVIDYIYGLVTVSTERLLHLNRPVLAVAKLPHLTDRFTDWEPALQAHYERWECEATDCDGHYHLA